MKENRIATFIGYLTSCCILYVLLLLVFYVTNRNILYWLAGLPVSLIVACGLTAFTYKKVPAKTFIFDRYKIVDIFEKAMWCPRFLYRNIEDEDNGRFLISYAQEAATLMLKSRSSPEIICKIIIVRKEEPRSVYELQNFLLQFRGSKVNSRENMVDSFKDLAEYIAHEFMEKRKNEFHRFFNPLDGRQQTEFRSLLIDFLNEFMAGHEDILYIGRGSAFSLHNEVKATVPC